MATTLRLASLGAAADVSRYTSPSQPTIQPMHQVQQELRVLFRAGRVHAHRLSFGPCKLGAEHRGLTKAHHAPLAEGKQRPVHEVFALEPRWCR